MLSNIVNRTEALSKLTALCEPTLVPPLSPGELDGILDSNLLGLTWSPNTTYTVGQIILPTKSNGRKYKVVVAGISGATEPTWPEYSGRYNTSAIDPLGQVVDNTVTFREDGYETGIGYDVQQAAFEAWDKKAAKASEMVSTPGVDMAKIFDRCEKMRDRFEQAVVA